MECLGKKEQTCEIRQKDTILNLTTKTELASFSSPPSFTGVWRPGNHHSAGAMTF